MKVRNLGRKSLGSACQVKELGLQLNPSDEA